MNQGKDFTLSSGAKLHVNMAPFRLGAALKNAIAKELRGIDMGGVELDSNVFASPALMDKALGIIGSKDVEDCIIALYSWATYDGVKLSEELLDDVKIGENIRGDYFEIALKLAEVNCGPFFRSALSAWKGRAGKSAASQP